MNKLVNDDYNNTFTITCDELNTDKLSCDFKLNARGGLSSAVVNIYLSLTHTKRL